MNVFSILIVFLTFAVKLVVIWGVYLDLIFFLCLRKLFNFFSFKFRTGTYLF